MKIIYGLEKFKKSSRKIVATIGVFDGVHLGHQRILKELIKIAKDICGQTLVITFHPHPLKVTENIKRPLLLISLQHRLKILSEFNIDICLVINFNKNFSQMSGEKFVKEILFEKIGINYLIIGSDFKLGKGQDSDKDKLKKLAKKYNFKIKLVRPVIIKGMFVKSTRIRNLIERGNITQAARFLNRPVSILGTVVKGDSRGKNLGYPTANIDAHQEIIPPSGVYAVRIRINNVSYAGISNIGLRPTFFISKTKRKQPNIEVHIFGFKQDIYGKDILIEFISKIRNEKKFLTKEKLIKQIEKDKAKAKIILFNYQS